MFESRSQTARLTLIRNLMIVLLILNICLVRTSSANDLTDEILKFFRSDVSSSLIWDDELRIQPESTGKQHVTAKPGDLINGRNVSQQCQQSLAQVTAALRDGQSWAFRFIDSSARTPSGLLDGTVSSFGDYDECLDIRSPRTASSSSSSSGKHCLLKFTAGSRLHEDKNESASSSPSSPGSEIASEVRDALFLFDTFTLNLGICVPSACDGNDLRFLLTPKLVKSVLKLHPDPIFCDTHESNSITFNKLSLGQLMSLSYLTSVICLVYVATIVHLVKGFRLRAILFSSFYSPVTKANEFKGVKESQVRKKRRFSLRFFSLVHNMNQLLAPASAVASPSTSHKREGSVDDIRFAFAVVTTVIHAQACGLEFRSFAKIFRLRTDFYDKFSWLMLQPFFNVVGIEGFFCISGLATVWSTSKLIQSRSPIDSITHSVCFRWLRVGPSVLTLVALDFVWPLFGSGPMFTEFTSYISSSCGENWWKTILMITNWTDPKDMCLVHMWYVSAEFQLFALGVLSLILIRWNERIGMSFCYLMIAIGMIVPGLKTYLFSYSPTVLIHQFRSYESQIKYFKAMYFPTYCHFTPFFIGIVFGHLRQSGQLDLEQIAKRKILAPFFFSWLVIIFYMPGFWNSFGMPLEPVMATLYSSLHRFMFSIGLLASIVMAREFKLFFLPSGDRGDGIRSRKRGREGEDQRETDLTNIIDNNNSVKDVTLADGSEVQFQVVPMRQAFLMAMAAFKCASRLCFSLYLTHSIFIRYNWFTSRSLFTFSEQANIMRGGYSFFCSMAAAFLFYLFFESPFENCRKCLKERFVVQHSCDASEGFSMEKKESATKSQ